MKLANITSISSIHTWATECIEGKLRGVLQDLVVEDSEGNEEYPTMEEMKKALEEALEVTPQDKCKRLQRLKIKRGESIKNFNWRYKKLYNNLPRIYQSFITVEDYTESISHRPFARAQVITQITGKHPFRQFSSNNYIEINNPNRNMRSRINDKFIATVTRQTRKYNTKKKPYDKHQKIVTLKEDPQPIEMPSKAQTNDQEMEAEVENINNEPKSNNEEEPLNNSKNREETETLKEIDLSVIANPSINKAKRDSKEERKSEIMSKKPEEEKKEGK
eukprot:jgi/Orpsp1_1/1184235/evm.model.c7180000088647.1